MLPPLFEGASHSRKRTLSQLGLSCLSWALFETSPQTHTSSALKPFILYAPGTLISPLLVRACVASPLVTPCSCLKAAPCSQQYLCGNPTCHSCMCLFPTLACASFPLVQVPLTHSCMCLFSTRACASSSTSMLAVPQGRLCCWAPCLCCLPAAPGIACTRAHACACTPACARALHST